MSSLGGIDKLIGKVDSFVDSACKLGIKKADLNGAIKKHVGNNPIIKDSGTGKIIYKNSDTGVQVVHDYHGKYFRIEDTTNITKRRYLDLNGYSLVNKTLSDGKIVGISKDEFQKMSHYTLE